jgi:non-ribosomal peptide synthetase component F
MMVSGPKRIVTKDAIPEPSAPMALAETVLPFAITGATGGSPVSLLRVMSGERLEALNNFCHQRTIELPALLRAAWDILLWRILGPHHPVVPELSSFGDYLSEDHVSHTSQPTGSTPYAFRYTATEPVEGPELLGNHLSDSALLFSCSRAQGYLQVALTYMSHRFARADIERLFDQYECLLASALERPDISVSELNLLSPEQRQQVLHDFNRTETAFPREKCLHALIEEQCRRSPDQLAVCSQGRAMTYQNLNIHADRLAQQLRGHGLQPEMLVLTFMRPSPEAVVSILGSLKAGAIVVPIDPNRPVTNLAALLLGTPPPVVIADSKHMDNLPEYSGPVLLIDQDDNSEPAELESNPADDQQPLPCHRGLMLWPNEQENSAPGPVLLSHRHLVQAVCGRALLDEPIRGCLIPSQLPWTQSASSILWTLVQGGTVHLGTHESSHSSSISHLVATPELYAELLRSGQVQELRDLRKVIISGAAYSSELVEQHEHARPATRLRFEYVAPHTVLASASVRCSSEHPEDRLPLGRPVANAQIYVLDPQQQPVPVWVVGEICIGGDHPPLFPDDQPQPERLLNLFSKTPGDRLVRTGQMGRWMADGTLELLNAKRAPAATANPAEATPQPHLRAWAAPGSTPPSLAQMDSLRVSIPTLPKPALEKASP